MARFSRLRRSAGLLLLAAGAGGFPASLASAHELGELHPESPSQKTAVTIARMGVVHAYNHGFKTLIQAGTVRDQVFLPAPASSQTLPAMLLAQKNGETRKNRCERNDSAEAGEITTYDAIANSYQALFDMPFSMDKVLTLSIEISPLQENCLPGINGCFGPAPLTSPTLRMSALTQERMMRHFAQQAAELDDCPGFICADAKTPANAEPCFAGVTSWKQLQAKHTDEAPAENPAEELCIETGIEPQPAEFVQHLPPRGDAPLANPPELAMAPHVVSPTMSPEEYAETFLAQETIYNSNLIEDESEVITKICERTLSDATSRRDQLHDDNVRPTAYDEPAASTCEAKDCLTPMLRALGGPISVTECESDTCKGFIIQFAPFTKPEAVAEVEAFDGPAQVTLQDGPGKLGSGFAWPAQPVQEETLDELAQRLERDFLRRAVAGQIQIPETCLGECAAACGTPSAAKCDGPANSCPPGPCTERGTPGIALPDPVCAVKLPAANDKAKTCTCTGCPKACGADCCCAKNERVPVPAVTINPYYQGPGAGTSLPRDVDFYLRSCVEGPAGQPCGPANAGHVSAGSACGTAAPACCDSPACTCSQACAATHPTPFPPQAHSPFAPVPALHAGPANFGPCAPVLTAPPMAMASQPPRGEWMVPVAAPAVMPGRPAVSPEMVEFHRDISRTLDQLAERCESQGLYEKADELRDLAQEYRMGARVIHQHLNALAPPPVSMPAVNPVAWFPAPGMMPYPMPAPPTYAPEPMPTFGTPLSPVAPAMRPQPLPIAQPMMVPRY